MRLYQLAIKHARKIKIGLGARNPNLTYQNILLKKC